MKALFDAKPCPNRAQKEAPSRGADVTVATIEVAQSHRSELNRRPLLSTNGGFERLSRRINDLTASFSLFLRQKSEKLAPETVPKACLESRGYASPLTNPLLGFRFSQAAQMDLERAAREDLRRFAFRRWN